MLNERLDDFSGSTEQYVVYLESQLRKSRDVIATLSNQNPVSPPASPILRAQPDQLQVQQFDPSTIIPRTTVPQWEKEINKLLDEVPTVALWLNKRQDLGLETVEVSIDVIAVLLGIRTLHKTSTTQERPSVDLFVLSPAAPLLQSAHSYALSAAELQTQNELATRLADYKQLILASYCAVLVHWDVPQRDVDVVMNVCFRGRNLERYQRGAVWVNRRISELFFHGWGHRASELFLLCK